jgi:hypothetical protein
MYESPAVPVNDSGAVGSPNVTVLASFDLALSPWEFQAVTR